MEMSTKRFQYVELMYLRIKIEIIKKYDILIYDLSFSCDHYIYTYIPYIMRIPSDRTYRKHET